MSAVIQPDVVGSSRDRVDGRLKVRGAAQYPLDVAKPGLESGQPRVHRRERHDRLSLVARPRATGRAGGA